MIKLEQALGALLYLKRIEQGKKFVRVANKAKITTDRLEDVEHSLGVYSLTLYARITHALGLNLWELIKECEESKDIKKIITLAAIQRKLLSRRKE